MEIKNKSRLAILIAGVVFIVGLLLSYYAFEKVSIPHVRDSHEVRPLIVGIVSMVVSAAFLIYRWRQAKNKPAA